MSPSRVLIIDDESNIRETMRLALETAGYTAETAADGRAGLESFGSGAGWDLVLLDQRMPGMDGTEALRRIREIRPDVEVIMVTAFATVDLAVDAMKAGAADLLRKPFTPDVLRRTVAAGLGRSRISVIPPVQPSVKSPVPLRAGFRSLDGYRLWPAPDTASSGSTVSGGVRRTPGPRGKRRARRSCFGRGGLGSPHEPRLGAAGDAARPHRCRRSRTRATRACPRSSPDFSCRLGTNIATLSAARSSGKKWVGVDAVGRWRDQRRKLAGMGVRVHPCRALRLHIDLPTPLGSRDGMGSRGMDS